MKETRIVLDHTVEPSSASIPLPPPVEGGFMLNWPNGQGFAGIGSFESVYGTYKDRVGKCDLSIVEGRYWSQSVIDGYHSNLAAVSSDYPNHRALIRINPFRYPTVDFDGRDIIQPNRELAVNAGLLDDWSLYYIDGADSWHVGLYAPVGSWDKQSRGLHVNYPILPVFDGKTFPELLFEAWNERLSMPWDANKDAREYIAGTLIDESHAIGYPRQDRQGTRIIYADWDNDGQNESDINVVDGGNLYRAGVLQMRDVAAIKLGSDRAFYGDGTEDDVDLANTSSDAQWIQAWDGRSMPFMRKDMGFWKVASGYFITSVYSAGKLMRSMDWARQLLKPDSQSNLGFSLLVNQHEVHEPADATDWAAMRLGRSISLLTPNILYSPQVDDHTPAPFLDEAVFPLGAPLVPSSWGPFGPPGSLYSGYAPRSADYYVPGAPGLGVYMHQFTNGMEVVNFHDPPRNAPWYPQSKDLIQLPDPGSQKAWAFIDATSGSHINSYGFTTLGQDPGFNTGALVPTDPTTGQFGYIELPRPGAATLERRSTGAPTEVLGRNWPWITAAWLVANHPKTAGLGSWAAAPYWIWAAQNDVICMQNRFSPSNPWQTENTYDGLENTRSVNPDCRVLLYLFPQHGDENPLSAQAWSNQIISEAGMNSYWWLWSAGGPQLFNELDGDIDSKAAFVNAFDVNMDGVILPTDSQGRSYAERYFQRISSYFHAIPFGTGSKSIIEHPNFAGWFNDSLDLWDRYPRKVSSDYVTRYTDPDYNLDGQYTELDNTTSVPAQSVDWGDPFDSGFVRYQKSILRYRDAAKEVLTNSHATLENIAFGGNGGRWEEFFQSDPAAATYPLSSWHFAKQMDYAFVEHSSRKWGFNIEDQGGEDVVRFTTGKGPSVILSALALNAHAMPDSSTNVPRLDNAFVAADGMLDGNESTPQAPSDISQIKYELARHYCYAVMHPRLAVAPVWDRSTPIPRLDETIYDLGAPVGSWWLYELDTTSTVQSLWSMMTLRPFDDVANETWWQEYENGWTFFCLKRPVKNAVWNPSSDGVTITLPAMSGFNHAMIDCTDTSYVNPKLGFGYYAQSPQINDGSVKTQLWVPAYGFRLTRKVPV